MLSPPQVSQISSVQRSPPVPSPQSLPTNIQENPSSTSESNLIAEEIEETDFSEYQDNLLWNVNVKKNYIDLPLGEIPEMKESFYDDQSNILTPSRSKGSLILQPVPQKRSFVAAGSATVREFPLVQDEGRNGEVVDDEECYAKVV